MNVKSQLVVAGLLLLAIAVLGNRCGSAEQGALDLGMPPSLSAHLEQSPPVGFCSLVGNVPAYNDRIVLTEAVFSRDQENTVLYSLECNEPQNYVWAQFNDALVYADESVKKRFNDLICPPGPCPSSKVRMKVVGRLEGTDDGGYGHLNAYRSQFRIMRITAVDAFQAPDR